jgi:hypothetical protein
MTKRMPFRVDGAVAQPIEYMESTFVIAHKKLHITIESVLDWART